MATSRTSSKKPIPKKTAAKRSTVPAVRKNVWNIGNMLGVSAFVYVGLAVAVIAFMQHVAQPVTLTHLTNDALLSRENTAFITAHRQLFDLEIRWLLVALLAVSLVAPVLYLTKLKKYYAERIARRRVLETRWADLALSSVVMIETVALLIGITDLMYLKLLGGFMITTCALGWLAERQNEKAAKPVWSAYGISVFTGLMPWVAIGITQTATLFYGVVRNPWYVYAVCFTALIGFILLALNQYRQHRRQSGWTDYAVVERNYQAINALTKVTFVGFLLAGLFK